MFSLRKRNSVDTAATSSSQSKSEKLQEQANLQSQQDQSNTSSPIDVDKVIEQIDPAFFKKDIDVVKYVLEETLNTSETKDKYLDELDNQFYMNEINKLKESHDALESKLSETVMKNYNSFVQGMSKVEEIGLDLAMTSVLCKNGRRRLQRAQENLVNGGLNILAKYRKRKALLNLVYYFSNIQNVLKNEKKIDQLIQSGDFPNAIQLLKSFHDTISKFKELYCIKEIGSKIQKLNDQLDKKIDDALTSVCSAFDPINYERILIAHKMLENLQLPNKIVNYYSQAIDGWIKNIVQSYALKSNKIQPEVAIKKKFNDLCRYIHHDEILPCLLQLFSTLADVMFNYYSMHLWHSESETIGGKNSNINTESSKSFEQKDANSEDSGHNSPETHDFDDVKTSIGRYRKTFWDLIQNKISIFLESTEFSHFKIERFLQVFHSVSMFCELGEEFGECSADRLKVKLQAKTKHYFMNFHRDVLENFRSMIENESWQRLELEPGYGMNEISKELKLTNRKDGSKRHTTLYHRYASKVRGFLKSNDHTLNPFKKAAEQGSFELDEDIINENDEDNFKNMNESDDEEQNNNQTFAKFEMKENNDGSTGKTAKGSGIPVFNSVSHSLMMRFGIYLRALEILRPINLDIFFALTTLFKFYMYSVYSLFASVKNEPLYPENDPEIDENLKSVFVKTRDSLIKINEEAKVENVQVKLPRLSGMVDIYKSPNYGLYERVVGIESMRFLLEVFKNIGPRLVNLVPQKNVTYVDYFLNSMETACNDIMNIVYRRVVHLLLNLDGYPNQIANCKWVVQNITEHNAYITSLIRDFKAFGKQIESVADKIPSSAVEKLWNIAVSGAMEMLVEGFSRIKKCNNDGRAVMQLDFTSFTTALSQFCPLNPLPKMNYVRYYIQGYYESGDHFYEWALQHKTEYTTKQFISLMNVGPGVNLKRKEKNELTTKLQELDSKKESNTGGSSSDSNHHEEGSGTLDVSSALKRANSLFGNFVSPKK